MTKELQKYPVKTVGLQEQFPPLAPNGRIGWRLFKSEEWLMAYVQWRSAQFVGEHGDINNKLLKKKKEAGLSTAIHKYYPGGIFQLREAIGISSIRKPNGYWTEERIVSEARDVFESQGVVSQSLLKKLGRDDLLHAGQNHYQGGWIKLREDIGAKTLRKFNFWTTERIVEEAQKCLKEHGAISREILNASGRDDLAVAISKKYPGGLNKLREALGIDSPQRARGYWTAESVEEVAKQVLQNGGRLTFNFLKENGFTSLGTVISRKYPGGIAALRENIGASLESHPIISTEEANSDLDQLLEEI